MSPIQLIKVDLQKASNPEKAKILQRFFKTGPGEYGEGDIFLGIQVPDIRKIAQKHNSLLLQDLEFLLKSKIHEERLVALLILVHNYNQRDKNTRREIIDFYLNSTEYINNWDLVDLSADKILGKHLFDKEKSVLYQLAKSPNIWERRISIISTFHFIKNNKFDDTLRISELLLKDKHDLIQKAVGWMLREIGKRDLKVLEDFLKKHYKTMSRTTLRYAIEKFPEEKRRNYLNGEI